MNSQARLYIYFTVIFIGFLFCCVIVQADPLPFDPSPPEPSINGFIGTTILNYPINLFFLIIISTLIIKHTNYGKSLDIPRKVFIKQLLLFTLIATIIGAVIDQLLVNKPLYDFGYSKYHPSYNPNLTIDGILIIIAIGLIIILFFFLSLFIIKMNKKNSIIFGVSMATINACFWYLVTDSSGAILLILLFFPLSIIFSILLVKSFVNEKQIH